MIAVKTIYNTEADGSEVPDDVVEEDMPCTYHGPFKNMDEAVHFMNEVWPDNDTDIYEQYADEYDIPEEWLNDPKSLFGDTEVPQSA